MFSLSTFVCVKLHLYSVPVSKMFPGGDTRNPVRQGSATHVQAMLGLVHEGHDGVRPRAAPDVGDIHAFQKNTG